MKIIEKSDPLHKNSYHLDLSEKDVSAILAIVPPPFMGTFETIKNYPATNWVSENMINEIVQTLEKNKDKDILEVEHGFLVRLTDIYKTSCEILDPIEIETITNVNWVDSMELYERMFVASRIADATTSY